MLGADPIALLYNIINDALINFNNCHGIYKLVIASDTKNKIDNIIDDGQTFTINVDDLVWIIKKDNSDNWTAKIKRLNRTKRPVYHNLSKLKDQRPISIIMGLFNDISTMMYGTGSYIYDHKYIFKKDDIGIL